MGKLTEAYKNDVGYKPECNVALALESLTDKEDRELLSNLIQDYDVSAYRIWQLAREAEIKLGRDAVMSHRKGKCSCG